MREDRLLIALGLLLAPSALAQDAPKRKGELGSEWVEANDSRQARVVFHIHEPDVPDPALYRPIGYDWKQLPLQSGWYPRAAFAAGQEGVVTLGITIGADGKPIACAVTGASGAAPLDAHACPHVLAYTRYFPALDREGKRRGGLVSASLRYELRLYMNTMTSGGGAQPKPRAAAAAPVTLASLGIVRKMIPSGIYGLGAQMLVGADGRATACNLYSPTRIDALDKQVCDRLMGLAYKPARDAAGGMVESVATISLALQ